MTTKRYDVEGMHCASCANIITRKIGKLPGVENINVNFANEKAEVTFDEDKVGVPVMNAQIEKLGYTLTPPQEEMQMDPGSTMDHSEHLKEKLTDSLKAKTEFAMPLTLTLFVLMIWDMAAQVWERIPAMPIPMQVFNTFGFLISSVFLFWVGSQFITGVARFIQYKVANMDTLIGIGTLTAYIYSSLIFLFPPVGVLLNAPEYTYFDVTIVVIGFVILGKYMEARSKEKTGMAIQKLIGLQAKTAVVIRGGQEIEIPVTEVVIGDRIIVKPGGKIPVDGKILEGETTIDESMITGESVPVDKKAPDFVIGSTINKQGRIVYEATKVGSDTMLSQIIKMVEEAQGSRAAIQNLADKISAYFVPVVLIIAVITLIVWATTGMLNFGLMAFVGILVIACPCALGLATPTAIIVGVGKGAKAGILIKNAESLEKVNKVKTLVFDKTGTITTGKPVLTDYISVDKKYKATAILKMAYSLEKSSDHPLASAINSKAIELKTGSFIVAKFQENQGIGVEGVIGGKKVAVRKPHENENSDKNIIRLETQGKTVVVLEINNKAVGILAISDTVKPEAEKALSELRKRGIKTIMLTGDNKLAAEFIAKQVGIDEVRSRVLPQDKSQIIKGIQESGQLVAMVGDGINDAPALTQADVGIAMATGTDIAIESSDITLLNGDIAKIPQVFKLSRLTIRTIKQNLFWAFIYNVIGIPLAAGALYPVYGIFLNPIFAGLAMAFSSVSVVLNSLRLNSAKI
jgi:Cu+-exporting ATPase